MVVDTTGAPVGHASVDDDFEAGITVPISVVSNIQAIL
jgi:hypothetical protein